MAFHHLPVDYALRRARFGVPVHPTDSSGVATMELDVSRRPSVTIGEYTIDHEFVQSCRLTLFRRQWSSPQRACTRLGYPPRADLAYESATAQRGHIYREQPPCGDVYSFATVREQTIFADAVEWQAIERTRATPQTVEQPRPHTEQPGASDSRGFTFT